MKAWEFCGPFAFVVLLALNGAVPAGAALVEVQGPDIQGPFSGFSSGSFTLPQFDTLGGTRTLTGVTVEVTIYSFGGKREFDNQSPASGSLNLAIGSSVRVKGPLPVSGTQIIVFPDAVTTASSTITGNPSPPDPQNARGIKIPIRLSGQAIRCRSGFGVPPSGGAETA